MSQLPAIGLSPPTAPASQGAGDLRDVELDEFLQLMIAELQNQDPLSPVENSDIVQQISQIREIGATNKLSDTLDAVLTGQNLATGSSLIGKEVEALSDIGDRFTGVVDRISIETVEDGPRTLRVHIGDESFRLENVSEIRPASEEVEAA